MFASTDIHGNKPLSWNTMALATVQPAASMVKLPVVCCSRPARIRSSVDLPQPLGPTMHRNSPAAIDRSMSTSAGTVPRDPSNTFPSLEISIRAPFRGGFMDVRENGPTPTPTLGPNLEKTWLGGGVKKEAVRLFP